MDCRGGCIKREDSALASRPRCGRSSGKNLSLFPGRSPPKLNADGRVDALLKAGGNTAIVAFKACRNGCFNYFFSSRDGWEGRGRLNHAKRESGGERG